MSLDKQNSLAIIPQDVSQLSAEIQRELETSVQDQLAGIQVRPPAIKIVHAAGLYQLGEDESKKAFQGIVVYNTFCYAYWHKEDMTLNPVLLDLPPDHNYDLPFCSSFDSVNGMRIQQDAVSDGKAVKICGKCHDCFLNEFGTGVDTGGKRTKSKACKNGRRLVVFVEGHMIPFLLTLPPTSIKEWDKYVTELSSSNVKLWTVYTTFQLESKERGPQKWSIFKAGTPKRVDLTNIETLYAIRKQFKQTLAAVEVTRDEFGPEEVEVEVTDAV